MSAFGLQLPGRSIWRDRTPTEIRHFFVTKVLPKVKPRSA